MNAAFGQLTNAEKLFSLHIISSTLVFLLIFIVLLHAKSPRKPSTDLPFFNRPRFYQITDLFARKRSFDNGRELMKAGFAGASVFGIITDNGYYVVLHPKFAEEIRDNPTLSSQKAFADLVHPNISGFEASAEILRHDGLFQHTVRTRLLKMLWHVSTALSDETTIALQAAWTDHSDWHVISPSREIPKLVAQVTSRVFIGDPACRDPEWIRVAVNYSIDIAQAAALLRLAPRSLRRLAAEFIPSCHRLRAHLRDAKKMVHSIIDERRMAREQALRERKEPKTYVDAIECFEEVMHDKNYNPVHAQLTLTFVAIHTTSDMLTQVLYDLAERAELVHALREEIKALLPQGWKKWTVNELKLMDSVLKESQRLKPFAFVSMRRVTEKPLFLSDGTMILEGTRIMVAADRQWDEAYYPNANVFDPYRFLKLREVPGCKGYSQLAAATSNNLSWGYGRHSCPGRFFAADEVKVMLCHILMKYDFEIQGQKPQVRGFGPMLVADPFATLAVRRRKEEIVL